MRLQRNAANRTATKDDAYDSFPPSFVVRPDGKRWHSLRALLLPYLEPELAKQYRLDEPWNGPHNQTLRLREPVSVATLHQTNMLAASSQEMDTAKNQLWAATFQMAWDQLKDELTA